jgi:hypothetical protein
MWRYVLLGSAHKNANGPCGQAGSDAISRAQEVIHGGSERPIHRQRTEACFAKVLTWKSEIATSINAQTTALGKIGWIGICVASLVALDAESEHDSST